MTGCRIEENQISLERISLADGRVTELSEDQILYNDEIPESKIMRRQRPRRRRKISYELY